MPLFILPLGVLTCSALLGLIGSLSVDVGDHDLCEAATILFSTKPLIAATKEVDPGAQIVIQPIDELDPELQPHIVSGGSPGGSVHLGDRGYLVWVDQSQVSTGQMGDLVAVLAHEIYGHVLPHLNNPERAFPEPCTDRIDHPEDVPCAVRRENEVRRSLNLPARPHYETPALIGPSHDPSPDPRESCPDG